MERKKPENGDELPIRNSTAEFLVFAKDNATDTIAVRFQDRMLWLTLQLSADLFEVDKSVISLHLPTSTMTENWTGIQLLQNMQQFIRKGAGNRIWKTWGM